MSKSSEQLKQIAEILNGRSLRERIYILLTLLVLLVVGWNYLFLEPALATRQQTKVEISRVSAEINQLHAEEPLVLQQSRLDPDREVRNQITQLEQAIKNLDQQLDAKFIDLLSPRQMPVLLQTLLKEQKGLQLIKLENLPPEPMLTSLGGGEAIPIGIYIHALNMELEGKYLALLDYLQILEKMEQRVFWDILTIESKEFATPKIRLQIHTLSLTEDWIGV